MRGPAVERGGPGDEGGRRIRKRGHAARRAAESAKSFGIKSARPQSLAELREYLRSAITSRGLCVVEVPVDPSVNRHLIEKLGEFWRGER